MLIINVIYCKMLVRISLKGKVREWLDSFLSMEVGQCFIASNLFVFCCFSLVLGISYS